MSLHFHVFKAVRSSNLPSYFHNVFDRASNALSAQSDNITRGQDDTKGLMS